MKIMFEMIRGVLLTAVMAVAYNSATGRGPNGLLRSAAGDLPPVVNWDVVSAICECWVTTSNWGGS